MQDPPGTEPEPPITYHIRVKGHLGQRWSAWFDHLTITLEPNGDTLLAGPIVDQAALHGILTKIRDLGLPLVSIMEAEPTRAAGADGDANTDRHRSSEETDA